MRTMRHALLGAALLFALGSLGACSTPGKPPEVLTKTELIDTPHHQFVEIPASLLAVQSLPDLPAPAYFDDADCKAGCYSNEQLRAALDSTLENRGVLVDHLHAIARLSDDAVSTNVKPRPPS